MRKFSRLFFVLLLLSVSLSLAACGEDCTHRDANDDLKCDLCEDYFEDGIDQTPPTCTHRDANDNGKCDECGADFSDGADITPPACTHRDADDNGKCDECGADFSDGTDITPPACTHRDADDNGKCDECGADFSDGADITPPACTHRDADDNGKCDECGADFSDGTDITPPACTHRDADDNGKCDECGADFSDGADITPPACTHRDADDNGKCDECGADFSDADEVTRTVNFRGSEGAQNPNPTTFVGSLTLLPAAKPWYTFTGWFTDEALTERKTALTAADDGTVLYAGFTLATYKAEYYANGALVHTQPFNYHTQSWIAPSVPTVEGYTAAWKSVTVEPRDLYISAEYTPKTYTIIYNNLDGGTHTNPEAYQTGDAFSLLAASKAGYHFTGWRTAEGESVQQITADMHENLSLYATYALATYTVSYRNTCGAELSALPTSYTILSERILLPAITAKGYTFEGWILGESRVDAIESGSHGDLVLTAKMTPSTYSIVLESPYGTLSSRTVTVRYGERFTLPVLSAEGKIFLGWYDNTGENATRYTDGSGASLLPYSHLSGRVLYARFAASGCMITYDTMGGAPMESTRVDYGSAFDTEKRPTKAGAVFAGWYDAELSVPYTASTVVKGDMTVYAKWIESLPISTAAELIAIRENTAANYHLTCDINLGGALWTPVECFSGILDGGGHTVRNFTLSTTAYRESFGFFSTLSGTVQNLSFADFTLNASVSSTAKMRIGAFAGYNEGRIYNCRVSDGVFAVTFTVPTHFCNLFVGTVAGESSGTVEGCESTLDMTVHVSHTFNSSAMFDEHFTSYFCVGGIVGRSSGALQSCVYHGEISHLAETRGGGERFLDDYSHVGGIIGENRGSVSGCYAILTATAKHSSHHSNGKGYLHLGGLVGENRGVCENSYATGSLSGQAATNLNLGGFVGGSHEQTASIKNCYAKVSVSGGSVGGIGGFAGYLNAPVQNCYATGDVTVSAATNVGGFVGYNQTGATVSKSYCSGSVTAAGGKCGYFAGYNGGVFFKCYYMRGATLLVGGEYKTYTTEYNTIEGILYSTLWSEEFLKDALYWDGEGWIILANEDPILEWEISVDHDYEKTVVEPTCEDFGFTVYSCRDCARYFIMDLLPAHGHDLKEERETVAPTCTERGYTATYCKRCDTVIPIDLTEPTGHTKGALAEQKDPTCTEDGYAIYDCSVCHEKNAVREILPSTGHTEVTVPGKAQTCTEEGYTERSYCSVCYEVIKAKRVIPKHFFRTVSTDTEASCTAAGECTVYCAVCDTEQRQEIAALGHEDLNHDAKCDRCSEFLGAMADTEFTEIRTAEELAAVQNALGGAYRLMENITLPADFQPIGSLSFPFTGYFDGNGKTVTLTGRENADAFAIFGYNRGVIADLTVSGGEGARFTVKNISTLLGFLCVYNEGTVIGCKTEGSFYIEISHSFRSSSYGHQKKEASLVFGQIAAVNRQTGEIRLSQCNANIQIVSSSHADCAAPRDRFFFLEKHYKTTLIEGALSLTVGMLAGRNEGLISHCSVSESITMGIKDKAESSLPTAVSSSRFGHAKASISVVYGTCIGANSGRAEALSTSTYEFFYIPTLDALQGEIDSGKFFSATYLYLFRSEGQIGAELQN